MLNRTDSRCIWRNNHWYGWAQTGLEGPRTEREGGEEKKKKNAATDAGSAVRESRKSTMGAMAGGQAGRKSDPTQLLLSSPALRCSVHSCRASESVKISSLLREGGLPEPPRPARSLAPILLPHHHHHHHRYPHRHHSAGGGALQRWAHQKQLSHTHTQTLKMMKGQLHSASMSQITLL